MRFATTLLLAAMAVASASPLRRFNLHDYRGDLDLLEIRSTVQGECKITPTEDAVKAFLNDAFKDAKPVSVGAQPVAVMMVGGPGAGKSSCREKLTSFGTNFVNIDLDAVLMKLFPNDDDKVYDCIGSAVPILKTITERALAGKYNLVNDGTGRNKDGKGASYDFLATSFKAQGYKVKIIAVYLPVQLALGRISERAKKENRKIDLDYTEKTYEAIAQLLPAYIADKEHYDDVQIASNIDKPRLIFSRDGGCEPRNSPPLQAPELDSLYQSICPAPAAKGGKANVVAKAMAKLTGLFGKKKEDVKKAE